MMQHEKSKTISILSRTRLGTLVPHRSSKHKIMNVEMKKAIAKNKNPNILATTKRN